MDFCQAYFDDLSRHSVIDFLAFLKGFLPEFLPEIFWALPSRFEKNPFAIFPISSEVPLEILSDFLEIL